MPEPPSEQVNAAVTSVLFQPAAFGGVAEPLIDGAVMSIRIVSVRVDVMPAPFVALQTTSVPVVSALNEAVPQPVVVATPDSGSSTVQSRLTAVLFQPFAFAAWFRTAMMSGPGEVDRRGRARERRDERPA